MSKSSSPSPDVGLLVLRLALGGILIAHGVRKLLPAFGGYSGFVEVVEAVGIPGPPSVMAAVAIASEVVGGAMVVLGILPRIGALAIAGTMAVAGYFVHWPNGFYLVTRVSAEQLESWAGPAEGAKPIPDGVEYTVALCAMALTIVLAGGGSIGLMSGGKKPPKKDGDKS